MARKRRDIVSKRPVVDKERRKLGTEVTLDTGEVKVYLNPGGKAAKYAAELKSGVRMTNDGTIKKTKKGEYMGLTDVKAAYRSGYLQARKDSAKAHNAKHGGKK